MRADLDAQTWPGTGRIVRVRMAGLTAREMAGRVTGEGFLDRLAGADLDALPAAADAPDLLGYVDLALRGGFPDAALLRGDAGRRAWLEGYVDQLLTRDVEALSLHRDPILLRRYFESLALNSAGLAGSKTLYEAAGVDRKTAAAYERLLETFVMVQVRPEVELNSSVPRLYHLRTRDGAHEVDLVAELAGGDIVGIEVKATAASDAKHLAWLRDRLGGRFLAGAVLHTGPRPFQLAERIFALPICTLWAEQRRSLRHRYV